MTPRLVATAILLITLPLACSDDDAGARSPSASTTSAPSESGAPRREPEPETTAYEPVDELIAQYRRDLLEQAFETANKIPSDPHHKTRAKEQEDVVAACLELGQAARALRYIPQIKNWRRGVAYADLAYYLVKNGFTNDVETYLQQALSAADEVLSSRNPQEWRRDRVRVKVARVRVLLGDPKGALAIQQGVVPSEVGKVGDDHPGLADDADFQAQVAVIDDVLGVGSLDHVKNTLGMCVRLADRFYDRSERREILFDRVRNAYEKMPPHLRISMLTAAADVALSHDDGPTAAALVKDARLLLKSSRWELQTEVALKARLARQRFLAGETGPAVAEIEEALGHYTAGRGTIVDIWRAAALIEVAVTYHVMGDTARALELTRQALEEATVNPNSRPRAEDLGNICVVLARADVEPDEATLALIQRVHQGLSSPW